MAGAMAMLPACTSRPASEPGGVPASAAPAPSSPTRVSTTPVARTDALWVERHAKILADVRAGGHRTAFLGDSITQGWETAGKDIWAQALAPLRPVNCGIGGDRTQHVLYRLDDGVLDALAGPGNDISTVVLLIGTNNTSPPPDSAENIAAGVLAVVDRVRTKLPSARILLMSIFPRGQWHNAQREVIADVNRRLLDAAQRDLDHITIVDLTSAYLSPTGELSASLMPDYLHLSHSGYQLWADAVLGALAKR